MDLPALEKAVRDLERSLDSVEFWLAVSTSLVVVGLVLEYWHDVRELIEKIKSRPPFPWKKLQEIVGGVLVTVGVTLELILQFQASRIETNIRSDSHQIEGLLDTSAGDARKKAGEAEERAAKAQQQATELLKEIQPRRLSTDQVKAISQALKTFSGRNVEVATYSTDVEGIILGQQIVKAFSGAGIHVRDMTGSVNSMGLPVFMGIMVSSDFPDKPLASAIVSLLKTDGHLAASLGVISFGQGTSIFVPPGTKADAMILVGVKPITIER